MLRLAVFVILLLSLPIGRARADVKETVDIATVTFPDGWQRTAKERTFVLYETGTQFGGESYKGNYSVKDWEVTLTNRFKGATHAFKAQFEAVAGGRILHLWRGDAEEVHLFKITPVK